MHSFGNFSAFFLMKKEVRFCQVSEIQILAFAENFSCLSHCEVRNPHPLYNLGWRWTRPFKFRTLTFLQFTLPIAKNRFVIYLPLQNLLWTGSDLNCGTKCCLLALLIFGNCSCVRRFELRILVYRINVHSRINVLLELFF